MIKVETITIHEFRGIRDLPLTFNAKNFAVCGPNGTGKSGIVDALEFCLTGNISRLTGRGTKVLSIKKHGPHVDSRDNPEKAYVELGVFIPSLNERATIRRTVKAPSAPTITPDHNEIKEVFDHVALHPEFVLSRRELIRYILSEPGDRAKEVQSLLKLEDLEKIRGLLQKIANAEQRSLENFVGKRKFATQQLLSALGISQDTATEILQAANKQRVIYGLPPIGGLEANTCIKDGLATATGTKTMPRVPKAQGVKDIQALRDKLGELTAEPAETNRLAIIKEINDLSADAGLLDGMSRHDMLQNALRHFDDDEAACPVCETEWEPEAFKEKVKSKLVHLQTVTAKRKTLETKLIPVSRDLDALASMIGQVGQYAAALPKPIDHAALDTYAKAQRADVDQIRRLLPLEDTIEAIESIKAPNKEVGDKLDEIESAIKALPEPTQQDAARDFLTVGQERLEAYREARRAFAAAKKKADKARAIADLYTETTTRELENIYVDVQTVFGKFYRAINHDDESNFDAKLTPSEGKLGFDVDFYGRGHFPPGAYHSEGHQDSMGLCLYLALMSHLQGEGFTLSVLDDVLMSVDAGHRREVCELLQREFPNTQFILTTHDEIWLNHMGSTGLVGQKASVNFRTWSVDVGPTEWDDRDIWTEIDDSLKKNDVKHAAGLLRHFLEHVAKEVCHSLSAPVEYRGDARYTLGDLLPPATSQLNKLLKAGKHAASTWGQAELATEIGERQADLEKAIANSRLEEWQMNAAIHYNEWANLKDTDFAPVVAAFRELWGLLRCDTCGSFYRLIKDRNQKHSLCCRCPKTNISLIKKPSEKKAA
ncbi:MAG: ATP-binding protein [Pseudomonadota bacterium]